MSDLWKFDAETQSWQQQNIEHALVRVARVVLGTHLLVNAYVIVCLGKLAELVWQLLQHLGCENTQVKTMVQTLVMVLAFMLVSAVVERVSSPIALPLSSVLQSTLPSHIMTIQFDIEFNLGNLLLTFIRVCFLACVALSLIVVRIMLLGFQYPITLFWFQETMLVCAALYLEG